jgi:hypothetical protein
MWAMVVAMAVTVAMDQAYFTAVVEPVDMQAMEAMAAMATDRL